MPMALFSKSDPEANLQKALDAERALHAELEARVFLIKNVLWTENGRYRTQQKFTDASLPPDIAARALKLGAAVPVDIYNETQQRQRGLAKHYLPTPADCTSLDDVAAQPEPRATETIQHSAFTVIPRGKPFQVGIAAARNLDNRKE